MLAGIDHLQGATPDEKQQVFVKTTLKSLFNRGLLAGHEKDGTTYYNLHKITSRNDGATDPDLLAPGLD